MDLPEFDALMQRSTPSQRRGIIRADRRRAEALSERMAITVAYGYLREKKSPSHDEVARLLGERFQAAATSEFVTDSAVAELAERVIAKLARLEHDFERIAVALAEYGAARDAYERTPSSPEAMSKVVSTWRAACLADDSFRRDMAADQDLVDLVAPLIPTREATEADVRQIVRALADHSALIRQRKRSERLADRSARAPVTFERCAEPGCKKGRVFFDDGGVGYCKRHGNERGLRPHGKVT